MKRIAGEDGILRREAAGMDDHQPLRDRVDRQRDDHRGNAQIGDADAVDEAERDAAADAERNRQRLADRPQPVAAVDIMPPTATTQGTERSIWPSRMTIIMPVAMTPRNEATFSCCSRYSGDRKLRE